MPSHTYQPVTRADRTYIPVSDVTLSIVEDKFTWANIADWTWADLYNSGKVHWIDWYYGIYVDAWTSLTAPSTTYAPVITPSQTYKE